MGTRYVMLFRVECSKLEDLQVPAKQAIPT